MSILVTGCAGFVGSNLVEKLLALNEKVIGIDNFDTFYSLRTKKRNIVEACRHHNFTFHEIDIRNYNELIDVFKKQKFQSVIHLAGLGGARNFVQYPQKYVSVNIVGTTNVLEASTTHEVGHVIFASSSSVYDDLAPVPFVESFPAEKQISPYSATKRSCELLGQSYSLQYDIHFTALRFFSIYGPRSRPDMMPFKCCHNITFRKPIILFDNGELKRDWVYFGDVVNGIIKAIDKPLNYNIINVGAGYAVSMRQFVEKLSSQLRIEAKIINKTAPKK